MKKKKLTEVEKLKLVNNKQKELLSTYAKSDKKRLNELTYLKIDMASLEGTIESQKETIERLNRAIDSNKNEVLNVHSENTMLRDEVIALKKSIVGLILKLDS